MLPVDPRLRACSLALAFSLAGTGAALARAGRVQVTLPSEQPSGNATVDQIPVEFHPAAAPEGAKTPAVVLLHPLGTKKLTEMRLFARYLATHSIGAAIMTLPYHMRRKPTGEKPGRRFVAHDVRKGVQALGQSAADVSTVANWLREQPSVDPERVGTIGVSLGAVVAHMAMGKDEQLTAGVAFSAEETSPTCAAAASSSTFRRARRR